MTSARAERQADNPSAALRSRILVGLGQTKTNLEKYSEADAVLRRALAVDSARGNVAGNDVARDLEAIGLNHFYAGALERAEPFILHAIRLRQRFEGPLSPSVSDNYNTLGSIAYLRHDLRSAERYFRGNLGVDLKVLGP